LFDDAGELTGAVNMLIDMSDQKRREAQIEFVMRELTHRSKNLLAIVQSVAAQTIKHSTSLEVFTDKFLGRLQAMARTHDLLVANDWAGADIQAVIRSEVNLFVEDNSGRIACSGASAKLSPTVAQTLSLAVHELATNALKYGALSDDDGRIDVQWTVEPSGPIAFTWREITSRTIGSPDRKGFGTQLLNVLFRNARLDFSPGGISFQGTLPHSGV